MAKISQNNLTIDIDFFSKKGFSKTNLFVILRDKIDSFKFYANEGKIVFPARFSSFEPMGNPPGFFAGMGYDDESVYVSVFVTENIACNLNMETKVGSSFEHPLVYLAELKAGMKNLLSTFLEDNEGMLTISSPKEDSIYNLFSLAGFSSILYSILSRQKILVIGELPQLLSFFKAVILLIPDEYRKLYGFTINLPPLDDDAIVFYGATPDLIQTFQSEIEELTSSIEAIDIVNLLEGKCYTNYEVKHLNQILFSIESDDPSEAINVVRNHFGELVALASKLSPKDDSTVAGNKLGVDYDLADLLVAMAKGLFYRRND